MVRDVTPLPPLGVIPPQLDSLDAYRERAQAHLSPASWAHIEAGAGRELTLAANRTAFDHLRLLPRALSDLRGGSTAVDLYGRRLVAPILLAPVAYQKLAHTDGELATARAATALGTTMVVSTLSSFTIEDIAAAGRQAAAELGTVAAPLWFQLYLQQDRGQSAELVRRAEAAGCEAIVLTVDTSIKRSSFDLPVGIDAANLRGMPRQTQTSAVGGSMLFGTLLLDGAPRWEDLAWLRSVTRLPLLVKGLLAVADVEQAIALGADGIIVSNHGGRVLDGLPTAVEVMPAIVKAVAGRVPLLLDGGVRAGTDVVKALAIGATAVLVGRLQYHALAVAGVAGVAHVLHLLRTELELTMAQLGCATLGDIDPRCLLAQR